MKSRPHNKTSVEKEKEIIKLYQLGYKHIDISKKLNISRSAIKNIIKRNNLNVRKRQRQIFGSEKVCTLCKEIKSIDQFSIVNNRKHSNINSSCKQCERMRVNQYRQKNIDKCREYERNWARKKRETSSTFKIAQNLRRRVREVIHMKSTKTEELLGCAFDSFINYLESQFQSGMSWDNYGNKKDQWNIDHIKPCSAFDLSVLEQQKACFHYTNLRPLWSHENFSKGPRLIVKPQMA